MLKRLLKLIILVLMIIGIYLGISITIKKQVPTQKQKEVENKIFSMIQLKNAEATNFYTYGRSFNISGKISNISEDNFESAKLVITDGLDYEKAYNLDYKFDKNILYFYSNNEINSGIIIDKLDSKEYYILLRLKLNNSIEPRYYSFVNSTECENINYYTITSEEKNRKANISFFEKDYNNKKYNFLTIKLEDAQLPEEIYDIAIDAGHGGKDNGENVGSITEADITLEYAKLLKQSLDENGYKVKLTRDDSNTNSYTYTNMYDENGRIGIACNSKAKLMISFHINNGVQNLKGFEIYSPCKSNLNFATEMANKINENSNIEFSNNKSFKENNGVYVRNFTKSEINKFADTAKRKGYEPYNITTDTPYMYTIREVGGLATNAYVDGRNIDYSKNEFYHCNQGIECYQIELGYIKNDLEIIRNEKEAYIKAITEAIINNF